MAVMAMILAGGESPALSVLTATALRGRAAFRRQVPHYRFHALELRQLGHLQRGGVDPVPTALAQRAHRGRQAVGS